MFQTTNQVQIIAPYLPTETSTLAAGSPSYLHQGTESSPVKPRPPFKFPFTKWRKPGPEMAGQSRKECKIWGVPNMEVPQVTMGWKILKWSIWFYMIEFCGQHLCYACNSFGMIVGNLISADPYSTSWPSTMLRWHDMMFVTSLRAGRDWWPSAGFRL